MEEHPRNMEENTKGKIDGINRKQKKQHQSISRM